MDELDAIVATVMDYWDGWFGGDAARMQRALHPDLAKRGIGIDASGQQLVDAMNAEDMIGWTRDGEGVAEKITDDKVEVQVSDGYHEIATVTVRSGVYREYLHLVKTADGWKIINALYTRTRED